jgi:hypothetical protein
MTAASSPTPLPKSRTILETMFKHCDICIERARNARHRSRQKIRLLFDRDDGKLSFEELRRRMQPIDEAHHRDRDTSTVEIEELWPYCEPELLAGAAAYLNQAEPAVKGDEYVKDEQTAQEFAKATVDLGLGQKIHLIALQRLRHRIFEAIESERADTGADIEEFLAKIAPRNADIATLHTKLIREQGSGKSQIEIALDFTDGDRDRADHLLRGVRRYRNRLNEWKE